MLQLHAEQGSCWRDRRRAAGHHSMKRVLPRTRSYILIARRQIVLVPSGEVTEGGVCCGHVRPGHV